MTIETGPAHSVVRLATSVDAKRAKGQPHGAGATGLGGVGGFMAVLASLETSQTADPTTTMVDVVQPGNMGIATAFAAPASLRTALDKAFEQRGGISIRIGNDANSIAVPDPEDPLETDIGRPSQVGLPDPGAAAMLAPHGPQPQTELLQGTSSLLAQSSSLPALATASAEPGSAGPAAGGVAGAKLSHTAVKSDGAAVLKELAADFASEPTGKMGKSQKDATARLALASATLAAPSESTGHSETRNIFAAAKLTEVPLTPIATALAMVNTVTPALREGQARERSIFRPNLDEGAASVSSYLPTAPSVVTPGAPDLVTPTDMYVAEKVAYWISHDVQSAEMKLEGIGADPVEVSIRMQGNEAHIAFRTDELQARAALESAGVHLKDLLQREGLVLSGVSVGTSNAGGAGEQERRPRQGGRQSAVAAVQSAQAGKSAIPHRITGGALDLFV